MVAARLEHDYPKSYPSEFGFTATSGLLREELTSHARLTLWVLLGAAACLLLIACANVANLTLARMSARERELTVRSALGAGKGRLLRQLATESLIIGLAAAGLGVVLASQSLHLLAAFTAGLTSRAREIHMDSTVLLVALGAAIATSIVFGSISALHSREEIGTGMKDGAPNVSSGRGRSRTRNALVVCQIAFSLVLLIGAGLLLRSLVNLQQVDPGFVPNRVLAMRLDLNWSKIPTATAATGTRRPFATNNPVATRRRFGRNFFELSARSGQCHWRSEERLQNRGTGASAGRVAAHRKCPRRKS